MRKKEILNQIRSKAEQEIPDVFSKIDLNTIEISETYESIKSPINLKRTLAYTFASLFIVFTVMIAYNFVYIPAVNDSEPLETETEIIGFQTVSAASLLSTIEVTELSLTEDNFIVSELANETVAIENEIDTINSYMNMVETTISNEAYMLYATVDSDREAYTYAFKYSGIDLAGKLISYTGYYNVVEEDGNSFQQGILVHEGKTYNFNSSLVETEIGSTFKYTISLNQNNYIEVTNVSDESTQKFSYHIYKGGNLSEESVLTLSSFKNQLNATIDIDMNNQSTLSLAFSRSYDDDTQEFTVTYQYNKMNQEANGMFTVSLVEDETTGKFQYQYTFDNNQNIVANRQNKGNQDATEDDFVTTSNGNSTNTSNENNTNNGNSEDNTNNGSNNNPGNSDSHGQNNSALNSTNLIII